MEGSIQKLEDLFPPEQLRLLAVVRDALIADPKAFEGKGKGDAGSLAD